MPYKYHKRRLLLDGTYCSAGPDCHKHGAELEARTYEQIKAAKEKYEFKKQLRLTGKMPTKGSHKSRGLRKLVPSYERSLAAVAPEIAAQFDLKANYPDTPETIFAGTDKQYGWVCDKGHKWSQSPTKRREGNNCPECGNKRAGKDNSFAAKNPEWAALLDVESTGFGAESVVPRSGKLGIWNCPTGNPEHKHEHYFYQKDRGDGCPYCSNHRLCRSNSLAYLFPEISKQFDSVYNKTTPDKVLAYCNTVYRWKCDNPKHPAWKVPVNNRTRLGSGCKNCIQTFTSKIEGYFRDDFIASNFMINVAKRHSHKLKLAWRTNKSMTVDIHGYHLATGAKVAIGYDGSYFHDNAERLARDITKTEALLLAGYKVIRIRENKLPHLNLHHPNLLQLGYEADYRYSAASRKPVITEIKMWLDG